MDQPFRFQWQGQNNDHRSQVTFEYVNWGALIKIVRDLTHQQCHYEGQYHAGGRHIVRRIAFDTGELRIARIPIIPKSIAIRTEPLLGLEKWWTKDRRYLMQSEIATMKFIKSRTEIPVPEVFNYITALEDNPVKLPFMLMQCIEGNMLFDIGGLEGLTEKQRTTIQKSVASIQIVGASLNKLGTLTLGPDNTFPIGPFQASFGSLGPYTSSRDYFISWAENAQFRNPRNLLPQPEDNAEIQKLKQATIAFPGLLKSTIVNQSSDHLSAYEGTYPVMHGDFFLHNLLLNDAYEVVWVIDWEDSCSVPLKVFAAGTNMFSNDQQGLQYIEDVKTKEKDLHQESGFSEAFGSPLGEIGICMARFEAGIMMCFEDVVDRYKAATHK